MRWLLWIRLNLKGDFYHVLTFRPPLAFICSWDQRLTPLCGSIALCQAQGPVSVSSLILGADPLLVVQPVVCSFTFSLFPNTKTIPVWHRSFSPSSHPGSGPLSPFKSRLREVSPSPPNSLSHVPQVYCLCYQLPSAEVIAFLHGLFWVLPGSPLFRAHSGPLLPSVAAVPDPGNVFRWQDYGLAE